MSNPERHYSDIFSVADFKVTACGEGASTINVGSLMFLDPPMPSSKKPVVGGAAAGVVAKDGDADAEVDVLGRQPNAYAQSACVEKQEAAAVDRGIEDGAKRVLLDAEGEASVDDDGDVLAEKIPVVKACYRLASAANAAAVEYAAAQAARDAVLARHAAEACEMARRHAEAEEAAEGALEAAALEFEYYLWRADRHYRLVADGVGVASAPRVRVGRAHLLQGVEYDDADAKDGRR